MCLSELAGASEVVCEYTCTGGFRCSLCELLVTGKQAGSTTNISPTSKAQGSETRAVRLSLDMSFSSGGKFRMFSPKPVGTALHMP